MSGPASVPASLGAWHQLLADAVRAEVPGAVRLRRRLHADPRSSGREEDTTAAVVAALDAGEGRPAAVTGRVVRVHSGAAPTVALRAELDGLAVAEATGVPWAASGGVMHACGHDVHLAALVAVCRAVRRVGGPAPVLAVLQPREEGEPSGGRDVAASGVLDEEGVGAVVGVHVQPQLPAGVVAATAGPVNAAVDHVTVTVRGHGGHGAYPHTTADPVLALAAVVVALHARVPSRVDPVVGAVLAVTQLAAGSAFNVVPDTARARGGLRTLRPEDRVVLHAAIEEVARHTAAAHGCTADVDIRVSDPVLRNDPDLARAAVPWLERAGAQVDDTFRSFGSDDFAHLCTDRPGLMLFLGVDGGEPDAAGRRPGLHSPRFLPPDDTVRQAALALLAGYLGAAGLHGPVPPPGRGV
ncbi:amidohydrolase [Geodermatophilus sp. TF02-6]|uniref:M20 metallopeptidase family protein n=1 Tax=Geodermatophilus sp. TF02-6 TaxID=2250575 RepID=UPI000DE94553|nr:amidohydrolase [Geodermatophilus sp. TF02-6]RBY78894.1 amidohydrolase [Geodermatophilus sp. TF02-6]